MERTIYQYHYTNWPDHGVPDHPLPILSFVRRSAAANGDGAGPILVHCRSADSAWDRSVASHTVFGITKPAIRRLGCGATYDLAGQDSCPLLETNSDSGIGWLDLDLRSATVISLIEAIGRSMALVQDMSIYVAARPAQSVPDHARPGVRINQ